jgi:hypothetical protein
MALLLQGMADARWIRHSRVENGEVEIRWTMRGLLIMESLAGHLGELPWPLPQNQFGCLQLVAEHLMVQIKQIKNLGDLLPPSDRQAR